MNLKDVCHSIHALPVAEEVRTKSNMAQINGCCAQSSDSSRLICKLLEQLKICRPCVVVLIPKSSDLQQDAKKRIDVSEHTNP